MSTHTFGALTAQASSTTNPRVLSVVVADGDTVLVVPVVVESATLRTGGAPTYAGRTMLQAGATQQPAASPETSVELWYLLNPPVGTANVSVPNAGVLTVRVAGVTGRSSTGASEFNVANGANNTSTNPTASVTTTKDGCFIVSVVGSGATTWAPSARDGTQLWDTDHGADGSGAQYLLQTSAGAQAAGWTFGTSDDWAVCVGAWAPAKGPMTMENYRAVSAGSGMSVSERIR